MLLTQHIRICMNVSNMTFWLLAHIIADPNLTATIREETRPAFKKDNVLDTQYLLTNCPRLDSVWHECLRLYTSVTTSRFVTHDTQLGSVFLKKGHPILFSARQIAFHDKRFGADDPLLFDDMRFFNDPTLKNVNSHRPFGGGKYVCLGRHLTRHVHAAFVAILLKNFEVGPAFPQVFPRVHENEPAVGVLTGVEEFFGS
jgi:cytochrome P450